MSAEVKPGYTLTEVGVIPEDWDAVLLDRVANRGSGHTPNKKIQAYWNGDIKWISLKDSDRLDNRFVYDTCDKVTFKGIANSSAVLHPAGTVVLSRDAGVGKSAIMSDSMAVSQHFIAWYWDNTLYNLFLYYWLQFKKKEFERIAIGSTIKTIGLGYFRILRIPYPNIAEQRVIAEALSDADALIESLEQLITKKRQIKQGAMQELLTGKKRLPGFSGEWEVKQLGDLFSFSGGYSASRDQLSSEGHCYLHYGDIHGSSKMIIDAKDDYQNIPKLNVPLKRIVSNSLLEDGDVVFVDASEDDEGTSKYIVVVNKDDIPFIAGLHTIVAKSKTDELTHEYRHYCFQTASVHQQFLFFAVGTKVSGISKSNIPKLTLPVPPYPEQAAIAEILMDMDAEIEVLLVKLEKARLIKQGMMPNLLTGKIRLL